MHIVKLAGATILTVTLSSAAFAAGTSSSTASTARSCDQLTLTSMDLASCRSQFTAADTQAEKDRVIASFANKQTNQDAMQRETTPRETMPSNRTNPNTAPNTRTAPDGMGNTTPPN